MRSSGSSPPPGPPRRGSGLKSGGGSAGGGKPRRLEARPAKGSTNAGVKGREDKDRIARAGKAKAPSADKQRAPRDVAAAPPEVDAPPGVAVRRAALDVLGLISKGRMLDEALDSCRTFDALEGPDRRFARALVAAVLRRRGTIDHVIGVYVDDALPKRAARVQDILRLVGAQAIVLGVPDHANVSTAVHLTKGMRETAGYAALVNAVARKIASHGVSIAAKLPERIDTPGWLWRSWERSYGPALTRSIARAHQGEPPLDLTVRDPADLPVLAAELGGVPIGRSSLRLVDAGPIAALAGYAEGRWWVQDAAAAIPATLFGEVAGKRIVDLCAAPGGKTMQLAAAGARVVALDQSGDRLARLEANLHRVRLTATLIKADILSLPLANAALREPADGALLDAPCTATGTIRRHPDLPWVKKESDLIDLAVQQAAMIDRASTLVRRGGDLIYCVCSLQPEEGEQQVEAALARNPRLIRRPIEPHEAPAFAAAITKSGDLRLTPALFNDRSGVDGFFIARFMVT